MSVQEENEGRFIESFSSNLEISKDKSELGGGHFRSLERTLYSVAPADWRIAWRVQVPALACARELLAAKARSEIRFYFCLFSCRRRLERFPATEVRLKR